MKVQHVQNYFFKHLYREQEWTGDCHLLQNLLLLFNPPPPFFPVKPSLLSVLLAFEQLWPCRGEGSSSKFGPCEFLPFSDKDIFTFTDIGCTFGLTEDKHHQQCPIACDPTVPIASICETLNILPVQNFEQKPQCRSVSHLEVVFRTSRERVSPMDQ